MSDRVKDVMNWPVQVVMTNIAFKDIAALLQRHRISALPVVDTDGRLVGIVSEADLLLKETHPVLGSTRLLASTRRRRALAKSQGQTAEELMSAPVATVGPDATTADAARLMLERNVKRLPVIDEHGLVLGIVTRGDLLKVYLRDDDAIRRDVLDLIGEIWPEGSGVNVQVRSGVVTLRGTVARRTDIELLTRVVASSRGVVGVVDELAFRTDDRARRLEPPEPLPSFGLTGRPRID